MKPSRDDDIYGSQFKRPLGSSYRTSYGLTGSGVTDTRGGRRSVGDGDNKKLTINDAKTYLKKVKETFLDQRDKYDMLLEVCIDFKAERIDTSVAIARVKELFKGHNNLIIGFCAFLGKECEITLDEEEPKNSVEEEAKSLINNIEKRFQHNEHVYKYFLDILRTYLMDNKDIAEVCDEVSTLFEGHVDLLEEFTRFLLPTK